MLLRKATGIEIDPDIYLEGVRNLEHAEKAQPVISGKCELINMDALNYEIDPKCNFFFFFNPFDYSSLKKMLAKIVESYNQNHRKITVFFAGNRINTEKCIKENNHFVWVEKEQHMAVCVLKR